MPIQIRRFHRLLLPALLLLAAGFGACSGSGDGVQDNDRIPITILHFNDFHAQNVPMTVTRTTDSGEKLPVAVGGFAWLGAYADSFRRTLPNAILLDAGDDFQGTPISAMTRGRSQFELLELLRPDAMTLGNHEFDYSGDTLRTLLEGVRFPVISANLWDKRRGSLFRPPFTVVRRGGVNVGVIGLTPTELPSLTMREHVRDFDLLDPAMAVRQAIADLRKGGAAYIIVVLSHMGVEADSALALKVDGIDVIVGGHSHTPIFVPRRVGGTVIVQAGSKGRWLGRLDLVYNRTSRTIVASKGMLVETRNDGVAPHPGLAAKVTEMESRVSARLDEVIGTLETDWKKISGPRECNIGSWIADAMRSAAGTDIAFMNTEGIRRSLGAGPIRVRDIWEISPFENTLVTFTVTGVQVAGMLLRQGRKDIHQFCQVGGLRYRYDRSLPDPRGLTVTVNGAPLDSARAYTVVTNSFIGGHLHDYFGLPEAEIEVRELPGRPIDRDVLIAAVRAQKTIRSAVDGRISITGQ